MSRGVITSDVLDVVQWQIPDFLSLDEDSKIESSRFSLDGCTWHMRVYPKCYKIDGWLSLYLHKDDPEIVLKTMTFFLGIKTKDGLLEEKWQLRNQTFGEESLNRGQWKFLRRYELHKRQSELLPSGTLTVTCRVERQVPTSEEVALNPVEMDCRRTTLVELETLSSDLKDLLTSERKCDFTISVQGKEFRVHRSVLLARSPVFRAMLEHDTAEAKSGILTIPDCDPDTFGKFLSFVYTGKLEEMTYRAAHHLYATAEKYDVQELKSFCTDYQRQNLTVENVCGVVLLADRYADDELLSSAQKFFNKNSYRVFLTSEWTAMLKNNIRLVDKLLRELASEALKASCKNA